MPLADMDLPLHMQCVFRVITRQVAPLNARTIFGPFDYKNYLSFDSAVDKVLAVE